jgi:hypothetical protein
VAIGDDLGAALAENAGPRHMKAYSDEPADHNTLIGRTRASLFHEALLVSKLCLEARKKGKLKLARMNTTTMSNASSVRLRYQLYRLTGLTRYVSSAPA